ncbi:hypothetical protein [Amycolatopsis thermophila]|uniref:Uncharacterized protein n=1 Tax=Amycolatopsis thermophila TaxID=206084 RepID=A0ABU0EPM3_9PSEU|nr:hypothetical protein [Amycolatopsis thermophila]MDQ0377251.1 hypothetical protein [Amycolatopsis thermophila]
MLDEPGGGGEGEHGGDQGEPGQARRVQDVPGEHRGEPVAGPGGDGERGAAGDLLGERRDGDQDRDENGDDPTRLGDGVGRDGGGGLRAGGERHEHRDGERDGHGGRLRDPVPWSIEDSEHRQGQDDERRDHRDRSEREGEALQSGARGEHTEAEHPRPVAHERDRPGRAPGDAAVLQPRPGRRGDRGNRRTEHPHGDHRRTSLTAREDARRWLRSSSSGWTSGGSSHTALGAGRPPSHPVEVRWFLIEEPPLLVVVDQRAPSVPCLSRSPARTPPPTRRTWLPTPAPPPTSRTSY